MASPSALQLARFYADRFHSAPSGSPSGSLWADRVIRQAQQVPLPLIDRESPWQPRVPDYEHAAGRVYNPWDVMASERVWQDDPPTLSESGDTVPPGSWANTGFARYVRGEQGYASEPGDFADMGFARYLRREGYADGGRPRPDTLAGDALPLPARPRSYGKGSVQPIPEPPLGQGNVLRRIALSVGQPMHDRVEAVSRGVPLPDPFRDPGGALAEFFSITPMGPFGSVRSLGRTEMQRQAAAREMDIFDSLPSAIRERLRYAPSDVRASMIANELRRGASEADILRWLDGMSR